MYRYMVVCMYVKVHKILLLKTDEFTYAKKTELYVLYACVCMCYFKENCSIIYGMHNSPQCVVSCNY